MSLTVFIIVLAAALLHATWNALVKGGSDKAAAMAAVVIGQGLFGLVGIALYPLPAQQSLPYLLAGVALHLGYQEFLIRAYGIGDLTQVYPIARGVAPLIVAIASVLLLGAALSAWEVLGVAVIAAGIMSISVAARSAGGFDPKMVMLALGTGVFIASYSMVDGIGARIAETSTGYYGWLAIGNAVCFMTYSRLLRPGQITAAFRGWRTILIGGGASFIAYALVVYAFTEAPIALVTALRETSIIFALLIGVVALKEPLSLAKIVSTFVTLLGAMILRFAKGMGG